jgi:carboxylesterase
MSISGETPEPSEPSDSLDETRDDTPPRGRGRRIGRWVLIGLGIVLALALLAMLIPISSSNLDARPEPTGSYDDAVARFDAIVDAEDDLELFEPCRSELLDHGERTTRAVVLFHGLTNCPVQFDEFAQEMYDTGVNVSSHELSATRSPGAPPPPVRSPSSSTRTTTRSTTVR